MLRSFAVAVFALSLPASAQVGVAIVQAPEQSWGMGLGPTPDDAFKGAINGCVEGGAMPEDCVPTNWCMPAGWTVTIGVMHVEGLHWSESVCGLPNRFAAEAVAEVLCDPASREYGILECALAQIYDPDGMPVLEY